MKIAVIGAGINGLYLAKNLAERGHKVTVFEKKEKIGKDVCSGLFSERILDFIPQSKNLIKNKIRFTIIHFPRKTIKLDFSKDFFVISHSALDNLVFDLAINSGAEVILNRAISDFPKGYDRIIGCDGAMSRIRNRLNLKDPRFRLAIRGFLPKNDFSNFVEAWAIRKGFLWKIPRGENIEYGIIGEPKDCQEIFNNFLTEKNLSLCDIKSALVPQSFLNFLIPKNSFVTLCGDSAGLTKPWSGGGVIWGLSAADTLLKNFPDFLRYQKEAKGAFFPKLIFSEIFTRMVYFFGFNFPWIFPKNLKMEGDFLNILNIWKMYGK